MLLAALGRSRVSLEPPIADLCSSWPLQDAPCIETPPLRKRQLQKLFFTTSPLQTSHSDQSGLGSIHFGTSPLQTSHSDLRVLLKSGLGSTHLCTSPLQTSHSDQRVLLKSGLGNIHFGTSPLQTFHSDQRVLLKSGLGSWHNLSGLDGQLNCPSNCPSTCTTPTSKVSASRQSRTKMC